MKQLLLPLSKQQRIWLKDLVNADIHDWEQMSARPVDEVGLRFFHLAKARITNMKTILANLEILDTVELVQTIKDNGLIPEIVHEHDGTICIAYRYVKVDV